MKTREELNGLKTEVENLSRKLAELNEEELNEVTGGTPESTPAKRISDNEIIERLIYGS